MTQTAVNRRGERLHKTATTVGRLRRREYVDDDFASITSKGLVEWRVFVVSRTEVEEEEDQEAAKEAQEDAPALQVKRSSLNLFA
jgi:hypothetical protein